VRGATPRTRFFFNQNTEPAESPSSIFLFFGSPKKTEAKKTTQGLRLRHRNLRFTPAEEKGGKDQLRAAKLSFVTPPVEKKSRW